MNWKKLFITVSIPLLGGMASGYIANRMNRHHSTKEQYIELKNPPGSPDPKVFPIVWTALYTTMGIAFYIVKAEKAEQTLENKYFYMQLGLNMLLSFLFFGLRLRGVAFIESFLLLSAILLTTYQFAKTSKIAAVFMIPYIAWITYAIYLNGGTWYLNKGKTEE